MYFRTAESKCVKLFKRRWIQQKHYRNEETLFNIFITFYLHFLALIEKKNRRKGAERLKVHQCLFRIYFWCIKDILAAVSTLGVAQSSRTLIKDLQDFYTKDILTC